MTRTYILPLLASGFAFLLGVDLANLIVYGSLGGVLAGFVANPLAGITHTAPFLLASIPPGLVGAALGSRFLGPAGRVPGAFMVSLLATLAFWLWLLMQM